MMQKQSLHRIYRRIHRLKKTAWLKKAGYAYEGQRAERAAFATKTLQELTNMVCPLGGRLRGAVLRQL